MSLESRVRRLEKQINLVSPEEGARAYVMLGIALGAFDKGINVERAVTYCVEEGITLKGALTKIDGATRGLPKKKVDANTLVGGGVNLSLNHQG
jgi:hypothetical protein